MSAIIAAPSGLTLFEAFKAKVESFRYSPVLAFAVDWDEDDIAGVPLIPEGGQLRPSSAPFSRLLWDGNTSDYTQTALDYLEVPE